MNATTTRKPRATDAPRESASHISLMPENGTCSVSGNALDESKARRDTDLQNLDQMLVRLCQKRESLTQLINRVLQARAIVSEGVPLISLDDPDPYSGEAYDPQTGRRA